MRRPLVVLWIVGTLAGLLAGLSIVDMALPKPYDGVVLEVDAPGRLLVRQVVPESGAARAGILPGDEIVGIARSAVRSNSHAASLLQQHAIGETVPYLVRREGKLAEVGLELGPRRIGTRSYLAAVLLGVSFLLIGIFVLRQQPRLAASQVFFVLCCLFLLFLVCRLRPASYSQIDRFVLGTGTAALALLPACFLHFFAIFPRPLWEARGGLRAPLPWSREACQRALFVAYALPPFVLVAATVLPRLLGRPVAVLSGAPVANWWLLAAYVPLGLFALHTNARHLPAQLPNANERRGANLVLFGALVGLLPFLGVLLWRPAWLGTDLFIWGALLPLSLVPLTFAYAIVRYRLFDVRLILRRSLLYTATTAVVTGVYALAIASFNTFFRGSSFATSPYFPVLFALAIVLLFEPLRRQVQGPIDRFFFADRSRLQAALIEMGEAFNARLDPASVVRDLVEELPRILGLRFAALYLLRSDDFERVAGPAEPAAPSAAHPGLLPPGAVLHLAHSPRGPHQPPTLHAGGAAAGRRAERRRGRGARRPGLVAAPHRAGSPLRPNRQRHAARGRRAAPAPRPAPSSGDRDRDLAAPRGARPPGRARARARDRRRDPALPDSRSGSRSAKTGASPRPAARRVTSAATSTPRLPVPSRAAERWSTATSPASRSRAPCS